MVRRRLDHVLVEDVARETCRQVAWYIAGVMGVEAWFATLDRHITFGIRLRHVQRQVQVQELYCKRVLVGNLFDWRPSDGQNIVRIHPFLRDFVFNTASSVSFRAPDGGDGVVCPNPFANDESWRLVQCCRQGRVPTCDMRYRESMLFMDERA